MSSQDGIIYMATSPSGKKYIGKVVNGNLKNRKKRHLLDAYMIDLSGNYKCNYKFANAIRKYGIDNFEWMVICKLPADILCNAEIYAIYMFDTYNNGYNSTIGGDGWSGRRHSKKTKQKMSKNQSGESNTFYGKHHSEETKKKLSEINLGENNSFYGKCHSEETKQKLSKMNSGKNSSNYGKHLSEETKRKLSEALTGRHCSEETKKKLSKINSGKNNPNYGKHHSEETKKRMSESAYGENSHSAKLTWVKVREIREKYKTKDYTHQQLADEYGVSQTSINNVINCITWKE